MSAGTYLCIMSDDFGMHPAINEGIVQAFVDGLLTDSNLMAPCPAFAEAAALARTHGIPVGMHATFTCEWDRYTWGPLTDAPSLRRPDGALKTLVELAWEGADEAEARAELRAQHAALLAEGLDLTHVSEHMGFDRAGKFGRVLASFVQDTGLPHRKLEPYTTWMPHYELNSVFSTSGTMPDLPSSKQLLRRTLQQLAPGYHLWLVHAAVDHPSLDEMCSPDFHAAGWARRFRAVDQALLLDPEVKEWISQLGIERVPFTRVPITPNS